jgi:hypothetical protein
VTGQPLQVDLGVSLTGQPGQNRDDSKDRTAETGDLERIVLEQNIWDTKPRQDSRERRHGQDYQDRKAREGSWDGTARIGKRGPDGQNIFARIRT